MDFQAQLRKILQPFLKSEQSVVLGIDIGTSAVKGVILTSTPAGLELTSWAVERTEGGDVKAGLNRLLTRLKFTTQIPVTSVSGKGTLIRYMDMPRMPLEDLRKSFVYDLDKYFPFDPQSIYTDCFILDGEAKEKKMPVLVAAVKKELVDDRLKLFKEVGIDLSHITINSIATANAFERLGPTVPAQGQAKAILDIGGSVSTLLIIKDRSPRFTRDIFTGSQEMSKQIANALGVDVAKAEQLKSDPGTQAAEVAEACAAALNHLVSEVRLSMDYFMTEKNIQIDEIFLMGGGSLFKGVEELFAKNLGMPAKIWDPVSRLRVNANGAGEIKSYSAQLGVAVGLALSKI